MNLIQRIDHWAAAAPEAIAHLSGDKTLTYGELRRRSDGLASFLRKRFGDDHRPIAVLGHREPEMLIAFLGAAKSGGFEVTYLQMDDRGRWQRQA